MYEFYGYNDKYGDDHTPYLSVLIHIQYDDIIGPYVVLLLLVVIVMLTPLMWKFWANGYWICAYKNIFMYIQTLPVHIRLDMDFLAM